MSSFDGILITIILTVITIIVSIIISSNKKMYKVVTLILVTVLSLGAIVCICLFAKRNNWESDFLGIEPHTQLEESAEVDSLINDSSTADISLETGCESESHGRVKTTSELKGFIYKLSNGDYPYYYSADGDADYEVNPAEPLHHVEIDLSNYDYLGKEIAVMRTEDTSGPQIIDNCDIGVIDFYISEGTYNLLIIDKEDGSVFEKVYVYIDHCGTYVV